MCVCVPVYLCVYTFLYVVYSTGLAAIVIHNLQMLYAPLSK